MRAIGEATPVDDLLHGERRSQQQLCGIADTLALDEVVGGHLSEILEFAVKVAHAYLHVVCQMVGGERAVVDMRLDEGGYGVDEILVLLMYELPLVVFKHACRRIVILLEVIPVFEETFCHSLQI